MARSKHLNPFSLSTFAPVSAVTAEESKSNTRRRTKRQLDGRHALKQFCTLTDILNRMRSVAGSENVGPRCPINNVVTVPKSALGSSRDKRVNPQNRDSKIMLDLASWPYHVTHAERLCLDHFISGDSRSTDRDSGSLLDRGRLGSSYSK